RSLQRAPRALPAWEPAPVAAPAAVAATATGAGGLAAAVLSVLGGVVIAVVMRNPLFLVFSAVGLLVAVGSRLSGRWARRTELRQRRASSRLERERFAAALAAQRADRAAYHRAVAPIVHDAVVAARERHATLWARRADHDDAFAVTLGWGRVTWRPAIDGVIDAADAAELGA